MKTLLTFIILIITGAITALLLLLKPDVIEVAPERPITAIEVLSVETQSTQLTVRSQGTLLPRTESDLSAEVSGRIIEVAENFRPGGSFQAGEALLWIDPADYQAAVAASRAELASAELALAQEIALAEQAEVDWLLLGQGEPSALTLRKPQMAQAQARIDSARAQLKRAQRDLERTVVEAPFDGRILSISADLGQFVSAAPSAPLARIFATDRGEIRLPITAREAERLEPGQSHSIFLTKANIPESPIWTARLARMESTIDPETRLLFAVAELPTPFEANTQQPTPLLRGQFMNALIEGRTVDAAYILPRYALRGSDTVYVVTKNETLETRRVRILQSDTDSVILSAEHSETDGLTPGERIALSPIAYYVEGMPVTILEDNTGNP